MSDSATRLLVVKLCELDAQHQAEAEASPAQDSARGPGRDLSWPDALRRQADQALGSMCNEAAEREPPEAGS